MIGGALSTYRAFGARISWGLGILDIIWHLGMHRTGSTTLQRFMDANQEPLRTAGIESWTPARTRSGLFTGLIHAGNDLTPDRINRGARASGLIGIDIARLSAAGTEALIVSEENMSGAIKANLRAERLYPDIAERLGRMRGAFGRPIRRIGLAVRSYDTFWTSSIIFGLCNGRALPTVEHLDRLVTQPRRWRDLIRGIAKTVPEAEIVVWPFEACAADPAGPVSWLAGRELPHRLAPATWANQSPRLNQIRTILESRGERAAKTSLPAGDGRWLPFDDDQTAALRAQYREDIDWLRAGADGIATFYDGQTATTDLQAIPKNQKQTETEVGGTQAATIAALTRTTRGQTYGKHGYMA